MILDSGEEIVAKIPTLNNGFSAYKHHRLGFEMEDVLC